MNTRCLPFRQNQIKKGDLPLLVDFSDVLHRKEKQLGC